MEIGTPAEDMAVDDFFAERSGFIVRDVACAERAFLRWKVACNGVLEQRKLRAQKQLHHNFLQQAAALSAWRAATCEARGAREMQIAGSRVKKALMSYLASTSYTLWEIRQQRRGSASTTYSALSGKEALEAHAVSFQMAKLWDSSRRSKLENTVTSDDGNDIVD